MVDNLALYEDSVRISSYRYFRNFLRNVKPQPAVEASEERMRMLSNKPGRLEVWIDGECGLCQRSRAWCELRDAEGRLHFTDFRSTDEDDLPMALSDHEISMWVRDNNGELLGGFAAWRRIMSELPGWRWLARLTAVPPFSVVGQPLYRLVAISRGRSPFLRKS